ncbi:hypothetical protein COW36_04300 [bacterium (Candidatus Blackallbacteria) CG17_big_fil_post_rev_8_21_14_2_50_48_46]|uniref:Peptidase n=1 Tax=bacterium (Candidatus Blackallbacteria) CG17_big_fil_post_rev_8_21_14_2_50_48_46 TaxID=2014261 RepID=A0A2M7G8T7_9BACT|nr:MAG: hypothetical protein COW64_04645 [bacterium (Candidatus Blackallbacteria) CG18_big_fil_WC_8_21_14_2_50_49_26]PIW18520.1 MAG: hypothetical protein COW36_04300 [bacterium (Candidatus Blackallbacteria) CG17_big_fil_post_rev_8_21_14_2_50_48_46]PIW46495.1 MAG: hypothetical protein COW20_16380 [bacterium (Candidatus Blackallbacteria) CG13_big_fil_rev_8_21_14_2_50_49_14]
MSSETPRPKKRRPLQFYTILLHRYLGYFFLGTTVVYAISGLAVNHIEDWNPQFNIAKQKAKIAAWKNPEDLQASEAQTLFEAFKLKAEFQAKNVFYPDDDTVEVLISANEKIRVDTQTWQAEHEVVTRRPVLHLFNFLHLNNAKKFWTLYADLYAFALLLIALTGLFMKKGSKGIWGEAGLWTLAGMVLPFLLILLYYR